MNSGKNIINAFEVVNKTHENVEKLMQFCRRMAEERKEFELKSPKFLRYRSDRNYHGWNTGIFFLLFQDTQDELLENGWRKGPVYVLEIMLYDSGLYQYGPLGEFGEPYLEMAKFEYEDMGKMPGRISPGDSYLFCDPLNEMEWEMREDELYVGSMAAEDSKNYLGLKRFVSKVVPLLQVNYENAYEAVFGTFKELKDQ